MTNFASFTLISALALMTACSPTKTAIGPSPAHLEKRGAVTHLVVNGKPYLALAGELLNNAASTAENARPVWARLSKANVNTVLVGVGWGWTEPEQGKFDFTALDGALQDARANNLHIVLLWFGSWKNGTSSYPPAWVKRNPDKYPVARDKDGRGREILSTLSVTNRDADAAAYAALMRHVREVDSATGTVIMIQMENEVGVLGDSRDRSKEADEAFAAPVPQELMDNLRKNKDALLPETRKLWDSAGGKMSGSWEEVFGKGTGADEAFMAWHYATYMNHIAEVGKKEYPLPVYVNAWLVQPQDKKPGDYPAVVPRPTITTSGGLARRRSTSFLRIFTWPTSPGSPPRTAATATRSSSPRLVPTPPTHSMPSASLMPRCTRRSPLRDASVTTIRSARPMASFSNSPR